MLIWDYIKTQALIIQQENYEPERWWRWWRTHPLTVIGESRKPIVWTRRLVATMVLTPWVMAIVNRMHEYRIKNEVKELLTTYKAKKVAITGSFGKTSVKQFLYTILDTAGYALTTPGSFNTYGGILRVLNQELMNQDYFIVELGAYYPGDIKAMAEMIKPDVGVITGIGPQHLERFGSLDAIKQTKFELMSECSQLIVNWEDENIRDYVIKNHLEDKVIKYTADLDRSTPRIFGTVMKRNLGMAVMIARELGLTEDEINRGLKFIYPPEHRMEISKLNRATLVDDTYSSNVRGFEQMMMDMKSLPGKKALITPGVVELGDQEIPVHERLGKLAHEVFDKVIGVGETARTKALEAEIIPLDTKLYWQKVTELSKEYDWIVLENDISEQYL